MVLLHILHNNFDFFVSIERILELLIMTGLDDDLVYEGCKSVCVGKGWLGCVCVSQEKFATTAAYGSCFAVQKCSQIKGEQNKNCRSE